MSSVPCTVGGGLNCDSVAQSRVCVDGVWRCPPGTIEIGDCFAHLRGGTGGAGGVGGADAAVGSGGGDDDAHVEGGAGSDAYIGSTDVASLGL